MTRSLPILTFHALDDGTDSVAFPPDVFTQGMARLARAGWRTLTVAQAVGLIRAGEAWPERGFVITFDDGYQSVFDRGLPVLRQLGFTGTIFMNTGLSLQPQLEPMENRPRMSWERLGEMQRAGIEIGAHTMTHPDLRGLGEAEIEREAAGSKAMIEQAIGVPVVSFAYPFGFHNPLARAVVQRHFAGACSGDLGLVTAGSDRYALERLEMYYFRSPASFDILMSPWLGAYLGARRTPRLIRQAIRRWADTGW